MKILLVLFLTSCILPGCYTSRNVKKIARHQNLKVEPVAGINLSDGTIQIDRSSAFDKNEPIYLFYDGDSLKYISTEKSGFNNASLMSLDLVGDSVYRLITHSDLRYYTEDTIEFHPTYVVANRVRYRGHAANKGDVLMSEFRCYYHTSDSLVRYSLRYPERPALDLATFAKDEMATRDFFKRSSAYTIPKVRKEDLIKKVR